MNLCLSDTKTNITSFDPDGSLFSGPFSYELLGDVAGKWKLDPSYGRKLLCCLKAIYWPATPYHPFDLFVTGYSAGLVKGPGVYAGSHTIRLKIYDTQSQFGVYNVTVTVCDCSVKSECHSSRQTATKAAFGAISIVIAALVLLLSTKLNHAE